MRYKRREDRELKVSYNTIIQDDYSNCLAQAGKTRLAIGISHLQEIFCIPRRVHGHADQFAINVDLSARSHKRSKIPYQISR